MPKRTTLTIFIAYLGVILIWSTTPLAIKWSAEGTGFIFGVVSRMWLGALVASMLTLLVYRNLPTHTKALRTYFAAGISIYAAMISVYWASLYIPSGLISVVFGLTPMTTSLFAQWWLNEKVSNWQWLGMSTGLFGLAFIFLHDGTTDSTLLYGMLVMLTSVCFHSASAIWVKRIDAKLPGLIITTGGLWVAIPFYTLTWILQGDPIPTQIALEPLLSILYLGVMGSVVGFAMYYYVLAHLSTSNVALITIITPVTALWIGLRFNQEAGNSNIWLGTLLVLTGLCIHQWGARFAAFVRPARMLTEVKSD